MSKVEQLNNNNVVGIGDIGVSDSSIENELPLAQAAVPETWCLVLEKKFQSIKIKQLLFNNLIFTTLLG